tara:strand:- start:16039 stop:17970 length:1932 start_codon:yes stop_codon:yes gene_type:complete
MDRKIKVLFQSDFSLAKTGFGRCAKALLTYLYQTDKYEIYHYCCGTMHTANPNLSRTPWISKGTLPDSRKELEELNKDPKREQMVNYGTLYLDDIVKEFKPDVYIAAQDIWGIDFAMGRSWFKKINSVFWTTLDSLPILPTAIKAGKKVDNFWVWSSFATKEMNKMKGLEHVETMHGPVEDKYFRPLPDDAKSRMRDRFSIPQDKFLIGFVFRNQLRKSVPNLLEGYSLFKKRNPKANSGLLLHTFFNEGWNIMKLAAEYGVPHEDIYCTYICRKCNNYQIDRFTSPERSCSICNSGEEQTQITCNVNDGVSEWQLNDIYNCMDAYCHPFTSGGQEYPIQEAKLAGLVTLVTNYSCGEEMCEREAESLPLEYSEYREHGTEFIKANTDPRSIAKNLQKVFNMPKEKRKAKGLKAREWTLKNYSMDSVGKKVEEKIDSFGPVNWDDISLEDEPVDPFYQIPQIENDSDWLVSLYQNILKMNWVDQEDDEIKKLSYELKHGKTTREKIEKNIRNSAAQNQMNEKYKDFENWLDKDDRGKRILYVAPHGPNDIFLSTSLFESLSEQYPDYNLYVATDPKFQELLDGNPYVHKVIPYFAVMDNCFWTEGQGSNQGHFEIAFTPHLSIHNNLEYLHNGKDNIAFDLKA